MLESYLQNLDLDIWDIGKQRRPRSDAAERSVLLRSTLFA